MGVAREVRGVPPQLVIRRPSAVTRAPLDRSFGAVTLGSRHFLVERPEVMDTMRDDAIDALAASLLPRLRALVTPDIAKFDHTVGIEDKQNGVVGYAHVLDGIAELSDGKLSVIELATKPVTPEAAAAQMVRLEGVTFHDANEPTKLAIALQILNAIKA